MIRHWAPGRGKCKIVRYLFQQKLRECEDHRLRGSDAPIHLRNEQCQWWEVEPQREGNDIRSGAAEGRAARSAAQ